MELWVYKILYRDQELNSNLLLLVQEERLHWKVKQNFQVKGCLSLQGELSFLLKELEKLQSKEKASILLKLDKTYYIPFHRSFFGGQDRFQSPKAHLIDSYSEEVSSGSRSYLNNRFLNGRNETWVLSKDLQSYFREVYCLSTKGKVELELSNFKGTLDQFLKKLEELYCGKYAKFYCYFIKTFKSSKEIERKIEPIGEIILSKSQTIQEVKEKTISPGVYILPLTLKEIQNLYEKVPK